MNKPKVYLCNKRGKYYARVLFKADGKRIEKVIPLRTSIESEAHLRKDMVKECAPSIASGNSYSFPWMNDDGKVKSIKFTIKDAVELYQKYREHLVKKSTFKRNEASLNRLLDVLGNKYPIENITNNDIEKFKKFYSGRHKPGGINVNLRAIRTFLNWLLEEKHITERIKVKMIDVGKPLPKYVSESEFKQIMELDWLSPFYKDAFEFYITTGCRKSEPFLGRIDGNWLIVDTDKSKTKIVRQIRLNERQIYILKEMKKKHDEHIAHGMHSYTHIDRYNKEFTLALKSINSNDTRTLHCLRHTFAVMRYLETRDIYLVRTEMGHTSVSMTELYAHFDIRRLSEDFPSLESQQSSKIISFVGTDSVGTNGLNYKSPYEKVG